MGTTCSARLEWQFKHLSRAINSSLTDVSDLPGSRLISMSKKHWGRSSAPMAAGKTRRLSSTPPWEKTEPTQNWKKSEPKAVWCNLHPPEKLKAIFIEAWTSLWIIAPSHHIERVERKCWKPTQRHYHVANYNRQCGFHTIQAEMEVFYLYQESLTRMMGGREGERERRSRIESKVFIKQVLYKVYVGRDSNDLEHVWGIKHQAREDSPCSSSPVQSCLAHPC